MKTSSYKIVLFILVFLGALIMIYPLLWMMASSFKPESLIFKNQSLLISQFTLDNYIQGLKGIGGVTYWQALKNSLIISIFVVAATVLSCSMTGYALSRLQFLGKKVCFILMLISMMLPFHVTLISRYIMFNAMGWVNTYLPLIVPSLFAIGSFFCFLYVQFIRGIPKELDEAAKIDGCSPIGIFFRIIMPLALPATISTAIFSFIWNWDDFFNQLIYINDPRKFTVTLLLKMYTDALSQSHFGILFAMSSISLIPIFIIFLTCQKYLVEGIATTGIKG